MKTIRTLLVAQLLCGAVLAAEPDWLNQPTLDDAEGQTSRGPGAKPGDAMLPDGPNLVVNGDFEKGRGVLIAGWEKVDNLTIRRVRGGPSGKGQCMEFDTDVYLKEWEKNNQDLGKGLPGKTTKTTTTGDKYDTVGGTHGLHLYSKTIRIEPGRSYMLSVAMKGPSAGTFFPKVFVKGYRRVNNSLREVWRGPLHCRTDPKKWLGFKWRAPKQISRFGVQEVKIVLYCYWPVGTYRIDDVVFRTVDPNSHRSPPGPEKPIDLTPPAESGGGDKAPKDEPVRY